MQIKKTLEAIAIALPLLAGCRGSFMAIGGHVIYPDNISAEQRECIKHCICNYNLEKCYRSSNCPAYSNDMNFTYEPTSIITIGEIPEAHPVPLKQSQYLSSEYPEKD